MLTSSCLALYKCLLSLRVSWQFIFTEAGKGHMCAGTIVDMKHLGVWEAFEVKVQTIKTAVESATLLLRIDDIVSGMSKKDRTAPGQSQPGGRQVEDPDAVRHVLLPDSALPICKHARHCRQIVICELSLPAAARAALHLPVSAGLKRVTHHDAVCCVKC